MPSPAALEWLLVKEHDVNFTHLSTRFPFFTGRLGVLSAYFGPLSTP